MYLSGDGRVVNHLTSDEAREDTGNIKRMCEWNDDIDLETSIKIN